jgi:glutathione S-transferase
MSGQGPYYGQASWFMRFHPEKVQSALDRYANEVKRIVGVIDAHLRKQAAEYNTKEPWLVGNKVAYVDLMFVMWDIILRDGQLAGENSLEEFTYWADWARRLRERPAVKKVVDHRYAMIAKK